jgi:peptide/nickel transport system substrate-binding protein
MNQVKGRTMIRHPRRVLAVFVAFVSALALTACGSSNDNNKSSGGGAAEVKPVSGQKKGGTLQVQSVEGFEHLDPGSSYFQLDYEVVYATQRPLYSFKPEDPEHVAPDLAAGPAKISADEKTVTVKIRPGVKFSPPVDREVTSKDVKFAIERGFNPSVANGYAGSYFGLLEGADKAKGGPISGIQTPDDQTIVFKFTEPFAGTAAQALSLPLSAPVPKEYIDKIKADDKTPSVYDSDPTKQAFTGPYVIKSYSPGKSIELARNPNWDPKTDYRPAYVNAVQWQIGTDPNVSGRKILTGKNLINGDTPSAPVVKLGVQKHKEQISFTPLGNRFIAMNTQIPPFDNVNLRRAVLAATDRRALQLTRGGPVAGDIATHFMAPTAPGFEAAGGTKGDFDFLDNPNGDMKVAAKYMKAAGFPSGKYSGPRITMVGDNSDPAAKSAQVALQTFQKLGFKVNFRSVQHETMYSKFCKVPKQKVNVCPNVGWLPDFPDGYAWLYVPFDGKAIAPVNNSNWPQLDNKEVNDAIDKASALSDPAERADAWGKVDKLITSLAPAVPWFWDKQPNIQSENVQGVIAQWNAAYDLSFTSLK